MSKFSARGKEPTTMCKQALTTSFGGGITRFSDASVLMNLYNAYTYGGSKHASAFVGASMVDGVLSSAFHIERNYTTLSSFWGYVAYRCVHEIGSYDVIPLQYKKPLYIFTSIVALGMVWKGPDIFAKKIEVGKTLKYMQIIANFFDERGVIDATAKKFEEGYISGISYSLKNINYLLSNKFILNSLLKQGISVVQLLLVQKFFHSVPTKELASVFASKSENPLNYLLQWSFSAIAKELIRLISNRLKSKLDESVKKEINLKLAELVLQDDNSQIIMKLDKEVRKLPQYIDCAGRESTEKLSLIFENTLLPIILKSKLGEDSGKNFAIKLFQSYPSFLLLDAFINKIFNLENITLVKDQLEKLFWKSDFHSDETENHSEHRQQTLPSGISISQLITTETYTFANIQEIAKLGGSKFMLKKLLAYHQRTQQDNQQQLSSGTNLLQDIVHTFFLAGLYKASKLSDESLFSLTQDLASLKSVLGLEQSIAFVGSALPKPEEISKIVMALKGKETSGPVRTTSSEMALQIKSYRLNKHDSSGTKPLLEIENLEFRPGIYAIMGQIGTGKTTFLTDIARCLAPVFESSGEFFYPVHQGKPIEQIFCGSVSFAPPATTLFERITYRLPPEYIKHNKDNLLREIINLSKTLGQIKCADNLETRVAGSGLDLSTGQGKLILLIGAVLYKQYLKEPVLFVLDETLANLDSETTKKVCKLIEFYFRDSIVISVDHQAITNTDFYHNYIDLSRFKPAIDIVHGSSAWAEETSLLAENLVSDHSVQLQ